MGKRSKKYDLYLAKNCFLMSGDTGNYTYLGRNQEQPLVLEHVIGGQDIGHEN